MKKNIFIVTSLATVLIAGAVLLWYVVLTSNNEMSHINSGIDERNINDSASAGPGIKFIFVDAVTGERIRNEKVMLDSDNGIRCFDVGCDSFDTIFETQTDQNGVAFIDFNQWPKFYFGHVILENWDCNGSISTSLSDNYLYLTEDTTELLLECVSKTYSADANHNKLLKLLVAGTKEELKNATVTIDIENCGGDLCSDLEDLTLTTNHLGNLFFDGDYVRADTYLIIDGYKPADIRYKYDERYVSFTEMNTSGEVSSDDSEKIQTLRSLQNAVELYFSEHDGTYPHPKTWEELGDMVQDYIKPFPLSDAVDETAVNYTYGFVPEDEEYCLITALTNDNQILMGDSDRKECGMRLGAWQSVSTGSAQTDCDDENLMFCLGT